MKTDSNLPLSEPPSGQPLRRRVFKIVLLATIVVIAACGTPSTARTPTYVTSVQATPGLSASVTPSMTIGVEYGILGVAPEYAKAGIHYAKLQDVFALWGNIEPEPGKYVWGPLDAIVLEYQQAGFTGLQMDSVCPLPLGIHCSSNTWCSARGCRILSRKRNIWMITRLS